MTHSVSSWVILLPLYVCLSISGLILFILVCLYGYEECYMQLFNIFHDKPSEVYVWLLLATGSILILGIAWTIWRVVRLITVVLITRLTRPLHRLRKH